MYSILSGNIKDKVFWKHFIICCIDEEITISIHKQEWRLL